MAVSPDDIGIVGVGRLGICLALSLESGGFNPLCTDIHLPTLHSIENKTLESLEPGVSDMLASSTNIKTTHNIHDVLDKKVIFVLVATPSLPDGSYNHSAIEDVLDDIHVYCSGKSEFDKKYMVICSTVMPTYCETLQSQVSKYNIEICYNPEFIAQGSILKDMRNPDIVLIGESSSAAGDIIQNIYEKIVHNSPRICRMSPTEAEITKISLNCFLTTKIAFANCVGDIVRSVGGDPTRVLSAIGSDSRVGSKYFRWGHGFGGPCFPRDNRAINFFARQHNLTNLIGESTDAINKLHIANLASYIKNTVPVDKKLLFTYLSYKPDSIIIEESQQLQLALQLSREGYLVYVKERDSVRSLIEREYPQSNFIYINDNDISDEFVDIHKLISA
jgi:nucleotide sugar dehydrogenase